MSDNSFSITLAEAVVVLGWIDREAIRRRGGNLSRAMVHPAEMAVLLALGPAVRAALGEVDHAALLAPARVRLTPEETELDIVTTGRDDMVPAGGMPLSPRDLDADLDITLDDPLLLVLFEFLSRDIDDWKGDNLAGAFVSVAEFWALNSVQCVLEPGGFYSARLDYREQVLAARVAVGGAVPAGFLALGADA